MQVKIHLDGFTIPVPNVSVRLQNTDPKTQPSATCATQAGADPGSVLTDANGNAVCNVVFGSVPGQGSFNILVGGLDPIQFDQTESPQPLAAPLAYFEYDGIHFSVTQVTASQVNVSSGNNQSLNPGQTSSPLVVKVTDSSGTVPVAGATVTFSVSPSAGASLGATTVTTDASGLAQTTLTLSGAADLAVHRQGRAGRHQFGCDFYGEHEYPDHRIDQSLGRPAELTGEPGLRSTPGGAGNRQQPSTPGKRRGQLLGQWAGNAVVQFRHHRREWSRSGQRHCRRRCGHGLRGRGRGQHLADLHSYRHTSRTGDQQRQLRECGRPGPGAFALQPGDGTRHRIGSRHSGTGVAIERVRPWNTSLAGDTVTVSNVAAPISSVGTVNGQEQLTFQVPCEATPGSCSGDDSRQRRFGHDEYHLDAGQPRESSKR